MEVGVECCCFLDHGLLRGVEGFFLDFDFCKCKGLTSIKKMVVIFKK